jgi:hypothetical protein
MEKKSEGDTKHKKQCVKYEVFEAVKISMLVF